MMLVERSELTVAEGKEDAFTAAMKETGTALLRGVEGVKSVQVGRGIENPQKFILLVEWESMDAHTAYSQTLASQEFRALVGPLVQGGTMEHFEIA
jgi:heme-degrading monooxygenase HmoA